MKSTRSHIKLKELIYLSILIALGIVLNMIEPPISPIPGAKLGLANIVILLALLFFGESEAIVVALLRAILSAFFKGMLHPIPLFTSVGGSIMAAIAMILIYDLYRKHFSIVGISIIGGIVNNLTQFFIVLYITKNSALWYYLPILLFLGGISGWVIGLITKILYNKTKAVVRNGS